MVDQHFIVQMFNLIKKEINELIEGKKSNIDNILLQNISCFRMANHKSAKKRSRQALKRRESNRSMLSKIRNNINNLNSLLSSKNVDEIQQSFSSLNSFLAKAVKKGLIKKAFASRKLSSLSKGLNKI